jgi:CPA2 family monovalent cation:H+ antiporter-2
MTATLIQDLLIILLAGFVAGVICRRAGVSTLVGYLLVGALLGSGGLGLVADDHHEIEHIAEGGVLLLLFTVGLEFSLDELVRLRRLLLVGGGIQMLMVAGPTVLVLVALGLAGRASALLGFGVAMSSTVLVFKALTEYGRASSPTGRRMIAILLFQDVALVPLLLLIPLLAGETREGLGGELLILLVTSGAVVLGVLTLREVIGRWVVPVLARLRSPELLVLFTLVVLGGSTLAVHAVGLPAVLGAFAAGLILSGNRLTSQMDAMVLPFREAFSAVFFVSLGLLFRAGILWREPLMMSFALVGVVLLKSAAATLAARMTGMGWRASAGIGVGLTQVGEFAFVLAFTGVEAGLLDRDHYDAMVILALATLTATPWLLRLGQRWSESSEAHGLEPSHGARVTAGRQAVVIGIGPVGREVTRRLEKRGMHVCAVDLSPVNLHMLAQDGFDTIAGNAQDPAVLRRANVEQAELVIVCVPVDEVALRIVGAVRSVNPTCSVLVRCRYMGNTRSLERAGASAVVSEEAEASQALLRALGDIPQS